MTTVSEFLDVARRTIYLIGEVDYDMSRRVIGGLELLDQTDGPIRVVLNSNGGDEADGYAIFDAITMCRNEVIMVGLGAVFSIAAAIFQAGDKRLLGPHAKMMVHNGTAPSEDAMKQDEVIELAEQLKKDTSKYYNILSAASQQTVEFIEELCGGESYFTADEAVKIGFADAVLTPLKTRLPKKKRRSKK